MTLTALLDKMFPGDPARDLPAFSETGQDLARALAPEVWEAVAAALLAVLPGVLADGGAGLGGETGDETGHDTDADTSPLDINTVLKALRRAAPKPMQAFTETALEQYFSAPLVIRALRGGPETLFPHARSLPDIDYDLLAPVLARAETAQEP